MSNKLQPKAFTLKHDGLARVLKTNLAVRASHQIEGDGDKEGKSVLGIWDTGATNTAISDKLAKALNLKAISQKPVNGVHGEQIVNVYIVDILLPNQVSILNIPVSEASNLLDCDVLVGMDIISFGDLSVSNANNKTFMSFRIPPNNNPVDYVKQIDEVNKKISIANAQNGKNIHSKGAGNKRIKARRKK